MTVIYSPTPPNVLKRKMVWVTSRAQIAMVGAKEWEKVLERKRQELHVPAVAVCGFTMFTYNDEVEYNWIWDILVFEKGISL